MEYKAVTGLITLQDELQLRVRMTLTDEQLSCHWLNSFKNILEKLLKTPWQQLKRPSRDPEYWDINLTQIHAFYSFW